MKTRSTKNRNKPAPKPELLSQAAPRARAAAGTQVLPDGGAFRLPGFAPWAALALLAFLVYLPTLHAGFTWDDDALTENRLVRSATGLFRIWTSPSLLPKEEHYWPMVYSSFWLEHLFFGMRPAVFHFTNVLLHAGCVLLLWRVLRRLAAPGAWLAAALFAVHPIHAESVGWVIERKDVLSGVFYLGAALAFLKWDGVGKMDGMDMMDGMDREERKGDACPVMGKRITLYVLSLGLFAAALLSKSIVITLPFALGVILWWRAGRVTRRQILALAPFAALAVAITAADMIFTRYVLALQSAKFSGAGLAPLARLQMAGGAFWVYLAKLAWPLRLATFYPKWSVGAGNVLAWLPLLGAAALLGGLWAARGRIGRGPAAAVAFFGLTLGPTLGLVDFSFLRFSWVADRFQYLASAGPLALGAAGLALLARRLKWPPNAARGGAAALLALLGLLGWRQAAFYESSVTLFGHSVAAHPESWLARCNHGWALHDAGRNAEAIPELREALRLAPTPDHTLAYYLASALAREGQPAEADHWFQESLRILPTFAPGHHNYGAFLASQGRLNEAVAHYRESLRLRPHYPDTLNNLGNALKRLGQLEEAERRLAEAVGLEPKLAEYHSNLAGVLMRENKMAEALAHCEMAVRLKPELAEAHDNMGVILHGMGKMAEAAEHFTAARRAQPQSPDINFHLGAAYEGMGKKSEAVECYREALRLDPQFPGIAERIKALDGR